MCLEAGPSGCWWSVRGAREGALLGELDPLSRQPLNDDQALRDSQLLLLSNPLHMISEGMYDVVLEVSER
jgi:hypothetical protein